MLNLYVPVFFFFFGLVFLFCFVNLLMTVSISLGFICLFKLLIWSWFNCGKCYLMRKLSISLSFSNFVEYRFLKNVVMVLWISSMSVAIAPFHFWFCYFRYSLSVYRLICIRVCQFYLFFSINQQFVYLSFVLFSLFLFMISPHKGSLFSVIYSYRCDFFFLFQRFQMW